ncbi:VapE domain-containing protein [Flavobacterium sp.]|uniref:VapE domain-containing protein n=1 Tax=Flavobacterium sp. TaxID=239 RepID=UPI002617457F|nr:VapE domain-containing protein [Flavobacterium sp.]
MSSAIEFKDIVLKNTTPGNIFAHFLNLSEIPKGNISSPFTDDKKPSFRIYQNGTFKCFSSGKQGDAFQFVADLNNLDCKGHFADVAKLIAKELNFSLQTALPVVTRISKVNQNTKLSRNTTLQSANNVTLQTESEAGLQTDYKVGLQTSLPGAIGISNKVPKTKLSRNTTLQSDNKVTLQSDVVRTKFKISVINKGMDQKHLLFWESLGVGKSTLQSYSVNAVDSFSYFDEKKGKDTLWNIFNYLAFSYEVNGNYEVYIPKQPEKKRDKFFCNGLQSDDIFGLLQLENTKAENIIICAGKKDTIVAVSRGFNAVTFRSENHLPTADQIKGLQSRCKTLFICYDNDAGGFSGRNKIIEKFPAIVPLQLPEGINDITDYFQAYSAEDSQKIIKQAEKEKAPIPEAEKELTTIFHIAEQYLNENYDLRYNAISLAVEINKKSTEDWSVCNENSLWLELQKKSIKIPQNSLIAILKSDFVPVYNPLKNYFENLPVWDKETDFILQFSNHVILEESENRNQFEYHFKKWCVRAVKCAIIDTYFNKQAFILTDDGLGQNIGKTSWCRFLCPSTLSEYIAQDIPENEKDARILFAKNFLVNLDELAGLSRKEINKLKSYFTLDKINERLPYDRKNSIIPRVASFIGSTNMSTFLQDETGSVRWLCFIVKSINWEYRNSFDINNLWAQAYALSQDKDFDSEMSREDIRNNELRNEKFQTISPEMDLIREYIEVAKNSDGADFLNPTKIMQYLNLHSPGIRLTPVGLGKALKSAGFIRTKYEGIYGYWIKKRPLDFSDVNFEKK